MMKKITAMNSRLNPSVLIISKTGKLKKECPVFISIQVEDRARTAPNKARYLGIDLFFRNAPENINNTPQIALIIIAFMSYAA
jgi:hypothetical protein